VDGGVNEHNVQDLVRAGADVLVAGNTVFNTEKPGRQAQTLQHLANRAYSLIV
jgi:ribulose-phosphate 3-epimerase